MRKSMIGFSLVMTATWYCTVYNSCAQIERDRPKNVPIGSVWVGGTDGVWVRANAKGRGLFEIRVFADVTGVGLNEGIYIISPECNIFPMSANELLELLSGYDGESFYFKEAAKGVNCKLVPYDSI